MADDVLKIFSEGRVDSKSLSNFMSAPSDVMVERRLAPSIKPLQFYLDFLNTIPTSFDAVITNGLTELESAVELYASGAAGENNWLARFVQDASGKSQQFVNDSLKTEVDSLKVISPSYVETLVSFGRYGIGVPEGVAKYAGGKYVLTVTGSLGSTTVSVNSGVIADAGDTAKWACVIKYVDGTYGLYQVQGYSGNSLTIYPALRQAVSDAVLANIHDMSNGQHYTEHGYKAFAQHIYNFDAITSLRGKYIASFLPKSSAGEWTKLGVPSLSYNIGLSPTNADNLLIGDASRTLRVTTSAVNDGVRWDVALNNDEGYVECNVGILSGGTATVSFYADGLLRDSRVVSTEVERCTFKYSLLKDGYITVTADSATATQIRIGRTVWWLGSQSETSLIPASTRKLVYMGDSWGTYHNAAVPSEIERLMKSKNPSAEVINMSKSGMTTAYARAWFDVALAYKPDIIIIEYFTNDNNTALGLGGITFTKPDGSTASTVVNKEQYLDNLSYMCRTAIAAGVKPVVILPSTVESQVQTQYHANLAIQLGLGSSFLPSAINASSITTTTNTSNINYTDKIEVKTEYNQALDFIVSSKGAVFKPRVMLFAGSILQIKNNNDSLLYDFRADNLKGLILSTIELTGTFAEQGIKLPKSIIADNGNILKLKGRDAASPLTSIDIGENADVVNLKSGLVPHIVTSLPTASASNRSQILLVQGATGVADKLSICIKNSRNNYEWLDL